MKEFKLISMTDFVLEQYQKWVNDEFYSIDFTLKIEKYANFLKQPLTLGMFVPCDEDGNVLNEPIEPHWTDEYETDNGTECFSLEMEDYRYELFAFNKAKEKVLFEGFHLIGDKEIELKGTDNCLVFNEKSVEFTNEFSQEKYVYTVEDLVELELKLTESAI